MNKRYDEIISKITPSGLNAPLHFKIVEMRAKQYDFYSYKWDDAAGYENFALELKCEQSNVEIPFYILIFKGALYKSKDNLMVCATLRSTIDGEPISGTDREITEMKIDGGAAILETVEAFERHWIENDDEESEASLLEEDPDLIQDLVLEIESWSKMSLCIKEDTNNVTGIRKAVFKELKKCDFYQVSVVCMNELQRLHQFLSKEEGEAFYIRTCGFWYNSDGLAAFKPGDEEFTKELYDKYLHSTAYYNAEDSAIVTLEKMSLDYLVDGEYGDV